MSDHLTATPSEKDRSFVERHGERYYAVDEAYDKRVYENTIGNYVKIVIVLLLFWSF